MRRTIHIFGGGTVQHLRNHMALCAPAYGTTAQVLYGKLVAEPHSGAVERHLTKMADSRSKLETNQDVEQRLREVLAKPETAAIVFNVALCDFAGQIGDVPSGKYAERLRSREGKQSVKLTPAPKLLPLIKQLRPDVFLAGFKTTASASVDDQVDLASRQMAETGADVVWANDTVTRRNVLVRPMARISPDPTVVRQWPHLVTLGTRDDLMGQLVTILKGQV